MVGMMMLLALLNLGGVTTSATLAWDAPTTNVDGSPCTDLAGYTVAITAEAVDLRVSGSPLATLEVVVPKTEAPMMSLLQGRTPGTYRAWVLAYDTSGNRSEWSEPLSFLFDPVGPAVPRTLRFK